MFNEPNQSSLFRPTQWWRLRRKSLLLANIMDNNILDPYCGSAEFCGGSSRGERWQRKKKCGKQVGEKQGWVFVYLPFSHLREAEFC